MLNSNKSSVKRYGNGQRGILGEHLYAHFYEGGHEGIKDMLVKIIDTMDVSDSTKKEGFWAYKLDIFVLKGLNFRNFEYFLTDFLSNLGQGGSSSDIKNYLKYNCKVLQNRGKLSYSLQTFIFRAYFESLKLVEKSSKSMD